MDKLSILSEIKSFLDGYNNDLNHLVNVETDPNTNEAECVIHEPGKDPVIKKVKYIPFMYIKNFKLHDLKLYANNPAIIENKKIQYGITITPLETGNHKRLINGYCFKITSSKSYNAILNFFKDGNINPYEKLMDNSGNIVKDAKGDPVYKYRELFYAPRTTEQFFISTQSRLFKGFEEYKDIHKVTFDIETTGLRYQISRVFSIGVRDNRGFEVILEVDKINDDASEAKLIQDFFNVIVYLKPAIISGYNSENFDFEFILGRSKELKMDLTQLTTPFKNDFNLRRRPNVSVKYGNTSEKYTATEIPYVSIIDIIHASKRTAAVNTEIKATGLKYISKYEKIAKPNRTYIPGEDKAISKYYNENKIFVIDENNKYLQIPDNYQDTATKLYVLQANKNDITDEQYKTLKNKYLGDDKKFVDWFRETAIPKNMLKFINGKKLVKQYLLDDLWETEKVDELYNQSSFMLAKIVPTTYQRVCTMGTAAIWNLLLTAWSYENNIAIPYSEKKEAFSGGLARCFKVGYSTRIVKIDYASLYPMLQLTWDIFPMFDITGVIKKMLLYLTTTRNIYKKLANGDDLNTEELALLKEIDHDVHIKYVNNEITSSDRAMFKIKQLPIKILNNSLFGALGSGISFNWSDNRCAARITCCGRLELRHAISWFSKFNCIALLAVTDGINFQIPNKTTIKVTNEGIFEDQEEGLVEDMWKYNDKVGVSALIEKFNNEEMMPPYMSVDNDGEYISCLNLSRINYATLAKIKDKKTGELKEKIKLTGNTIKSKVMPEYIEEFIDKGFELILHGKGKEFVDYYYDYVDDLRFMRIPLKKIASKSKVKMTINAYKKRGRDKNGREKGKQAHMELLIEKREKIAEELFEKYRSELIISKPDEKLSISDKMKLIINYMPPEPELDSVVYHVNTGYLQSHGNSTMINDKETGELRYAATLVSNEDLLENPDMLGKYNVPKYLKAFNSRVSSLLMGFDEKVQKTMLSKFVKKTVKDEFGNKRVVEDITKQSFNPDDLILKNFNSDTFDESMHLEKMEVEFWNKTGYNPKLVWDGFSMYDDDPVYFEIYENALKYLNDIMDKNNKPRIKSTNEKYEKDDMVLIKDGCQYQLGVYNGVYVKIIREDVDVPKSDLEIELDRKRAVEDEKLQNLAITLAFETEKDVYLKAMKDKREKYFPLFKEQFGLGESITLNKLIDEVDGGASMLDEYIVNSENNREEEADAYMDLDDVE